MVAIERQHVRLRPEAIQAGTQQRRAVQGKRSHRVLAQQVVQLRLAGHLDQRQGQLGLGEYDLRRFTAVADETGTQDFVLIDQGLQSCLQVSDMQVAAQAHRAGQVVGRALRLQLLEEPQALLGERQR
ncbi:hypothetical protein [Pseudomonas sp. 24 E 13]|nr:hypothetical protein [Pseudomonas sp. 24 E 13]CRM98732.1 hypothetical protein [Pseudomonas sp. 34 E 7]